MILMPLFENIRKCVCRRHGLSRRLTRVLFNVKINESFKSQNIPSQIRVGLCFWFDRLGFIGLHSSWGSSRNGFVQKTWKPTRYEKDYLWPWGGETNQVDRLQLLYSCKYCQTVFATYWGRDFGSWIWRKTAFYSWHSRWSSPNRSNALVSIVPKSMLFDETLFYVIVWFLIISFS